MAVAAPHVAAVQLGIKILVASFEVDASMRATLLRELQGRLVGVKEEVALPFVAVLGLLVQRHPRAVLEHANLLKVSVLGRDPAYRWIHRQTVCAKAWRVGPGQSWTMQICSSERCYRWSYRRFA